ncbi:hypothetical protein MOQ72_27150 [Saccharopolyspora sp. K220]|uniref:hypothetical protein n=1 Tax=Saccharopolyspora soli TaxID=2926618 RepID=UPI001F55F318|nr:hypothetical protein [Saccharopolyspora soli]MCI2421126.1 hypothetical protein [Saccharopolyspora soli]
MIVRPDGVYRPAPDLLRSIMFWIGHDDRPTTAADCRIYEPPIRIWFERTYPADPVSEIWFSRPELLTWPIDQPRSGQDTVVEGGVTLGSGRAFRLLLELHTSSCNCAWCGAEDIVAGEWEWVTVPDPDH